MHFGVREHAMGAIVNGLVLSTLRAFGASFLTFSDYMRASIRLAALMKLRCFTLHPRLDRALARMDRPISRSSSWWGWRAIPNLIVLRPADAKRGGSKRIKVIMGLGDPAGVPRSQPAEAADFRTAAAYAPAAGLARGAYVMADARTASRT